MRVLLVSANTEKINMPTMPLGLAMVCAAARRAGHRTRFLDLMFQPDPLATLRRAIAEHRPDVIGISVRNIDDQNLQGPRLLVDKVGPVVEACRACSSARVVLGGAGYSLFPRAALSLLGADLGVQGEGERAFVALLDRLGRDEDPGDLPGIQLPQGPVAAGDHAQLDTLPLPDDELWACVDPATENLWVPVESRRGCANDCSYCSTALIQGRKHRCRSPREVVEQVARMAGAGFSRFYFVDNSFNIPEAQGLELCYSMRQLGLDITWRCILYPHRVSEELVRAMSQAGCVEVALGFESGSEPVLQRMNKRFTPDDVSRAAALLEAHGIRRMGFLLLGGPGETRQTVEQSLAFAESLELESLRTTIGIRIYPNTPLARIAVDEGVIEADDDLLLPRFYLAPGLAPWIYQRVTAGVVGRPR